MMAGFVCYYPTDGGFAGGIFYNCAWLGNKKSFMFQHPGVSIDSSSHGSESIVHGSAGQASPRPGVMPGHAAMLVAGVINIGVNAIQPAAMAFDCFPEQCGLPSSCYVAVQEFGNLLSSALLVHVLLDNTLHMVCGVAILQFFGLSMFQVVLCDGNRQHAWHISPVHPNRAVPDIVTRRGSALSHLARRDQ